MGPEVPLIGGFRVWNSATVALQDWTSCCASGLVRLLCVWSSYRDQKELSYPTRETPESSFDTPLKVLELFEV